MEEQGSSFFKQKSQQFRVKIKKKIQNVKQVAYFQSNGTSGAFIISTEDSLNIVNKAGQIKLSHNKKNKNVSNLVQLNSSTAAFYEPNTNKIVTLNISSFQVLQKIIQAQPNSPKNQFQLIYFSFLSCIALVQKNSEEKQLNITYFQQRQNQFKPLFNCNTEPDQWNTNLKIYKINENGLIGWTQINSQGINLHVCSLDKGYRKGSLQNICPQDVQIASILNDGSNFIHLALISKKPLKNLPVLIVQTSKNFTDFQKVRFAENSASAKYGVTQIFQVKNHGKFIILKSKANKKGINFIYSLQAQTIVGQFQTKESLSLNLLAYSLKSMTQYEYSQSKQEILITLHHIQSLKNSTVANIFENISRVKNIVKTNQKAILIFGARKSGKSTLRHFLCGRELQRIYQQELGYFQVKYKKAQNEKQEQGNSFFVDSSKQGAIIQLPDFTETPQVLPQTTFLLQAILKEFKQLHLLVTIPIQQIHQPDTYQRIFQSIVQLLSKIGLKLSQSQIGDFMSIMLTKVQDSDSIQLFKEHIQLMKDQNEKIGNIMQRINQKESIISFQNKQYQVEETQAIVSNLFSSAMLTVQQNMYRQLRQQLTFRQEGNKLIKDLLAQSSYQYQLVNNLLLYLSHILTSIPQNYSLQSLNQQQNLLFGESFSKDQPNQSTDELIYPFFMIIAELKLIIEKKSNQNPQGINRLKNYTLQFADQYEKIVSEEESLQLKQTFEFFLVSLTLELQYEIQINNQENLIKILKNSPYSIFGTFFKPIFQKLSQNQAVNSQSSLMEDLCKYLEQQTGEGRVILKHVKVAMSYQKQKQFYLKNKQKLLATICNLPANAMKLDLMLQQIAGFMRNQRFSNEELPKLRFYLKQASRICQFHQLFVEAIVLLMIIPDFIGIQVLLEELVDNRKKNSGLQNKKLFSKIEDDLIDQLIVICRQCIRDSLVSKLLYIKSLNKEIGTKQTAIKKLETQARNKELSKKQALTKYLEKLQKQTQLFFYNLKNESFKKLIQNRKEIIQHCIKYEQESPSFADLQALNWVIEKIPIPS